MSVTQLTLLTSLSMMGAGIIMLPAKFAEIGAISMLSWIVTALASGAVAYVFAQCGMLSKRMGGLGGFAEYAFGEPGAFLVNYSYAISLVFGNIAISLAAVSYGLSWFHLPFSSVFACIGCVLLLWIASLLTFRSPYITGRITGIFVWALLLPLITLVIVVSVPSLPAGGKTRGGFHKTAPYELHGSVSRLTLSDNAQHNSAAAML